jgi:hypothetical protein
MSHKERKPGYYWVKNATNARTFYSNCAVVNNPVPVLMDLYNGEPFKRLSL